MTVVVIGAVVYLKQDAIIFCGTSNGVKVDGIFRIVGMTDYHDVRISHCSDNRRRILRQSSRLNARIVQAGNCVVETFQNLRGQICTAGVVDYVEFRAHDDFDAVEFARNDREV